MRRLNNFTASQASQRGAALLVAIIMLLIITVLAISGAREAALESRIVGNFTEHQKLLTGAESGLRDGEVNLVKSIYPLDPTADCSSGGDSKPCLLKLPSNTYTYSIDFSDTKMYRAYKPTDGTIKNIDTNVFWYGRPAPSGGQDGESENPEYGSMLTGTGVFRYEVNSSAQSTVSGSTVILRSTTAKLFDAGN